MHNTDVQLSVGSDPTENRPNYCYDDDYYSICSAEDKNPGPYVCKANIQLVSYNPRPQDLQF